ncbi:cyclic nucleotide-binding protein [Nocardioides sp. Soil777]|uniref:cyclic nucleotide-binding domain-containing protein n=1 Tax=Nocardioides sp. Soil777 TaxID=1736409 RepID=UPI0007025F6E|nr:cyclic nucleotide-binding domain-containing protein [Nocardioides sp. Soil777]KRF00815.1 cyclic nucleotide-binding protein [Nocardioides sp. Soil777]
MTSSIFDGLSPADVARIRSAGTTLTLPQGWSPISEQTPADKAYILEEGEVSVRRRGEEVATLGPGQIIGEAAILNRSLRTASVVATTPLRVLHFTGEALERLVGEVPAFGEAVRSATAGRQAQP